MYLNIGSNRGDSRAFLRQAVASLSEHPALHDARLRVSPEVTSLPEGFDSSNMFVNIGVALDFPDEAILPDPHDFLALTQGIEHQIAPDDAHRNPDGSYRDRFIDIDIIEYDRRVVDTPTLTIPHPRALNRSFVVKPMQFLDPAWPYGTTRKVEHESHVKKTTTEMGRDSIAEFKRKTKTPVVVVLDNLRSQNNIGSIFRTADAFNLTGVALCGITATPPAQQIHKTALGAELSVDWRYFATTAEAVEHLRNEGYTILCLEQVHNSIALNEFTPKKGERYALIAGNEVTGVDQAVVDTADICLEIPQAGTKHSLNVATSTAIALWHLFTPTLQT